MITAGIGGGIAAKFPTLSNTPLLQRLLKNGVAVLTAQLAEVSLNLRHDIDPRAIAAQMLGATMGEDISAQLGDSVADQATAAALSTASSAVLGSAITHTPLDAENLAETMLGTAIGTSIGAKFAPKPGEDLLGNKHTTKHVPSITKQAQAQQKQQRSATAAEKKHDDLHQPHKPKGPKHKLYDPSNDPEILKAEAVANMSVPKADLAHQLSAARAPWHPGLFNKKTLLNQVIDAKTFAPYEGHAREDALWAGVDYINAVGDGIGYIIQHPMNAVTGLGVLGNETYRYLSSHGVDVESDHYFHAMGDNISATLSAAMNYDPRAVGTLISIPFGAGLGSRLGHVTNLNEMGASAALKGTEYTVKAVKLAGAHTTRAAKAVMQQSARIGKSAARFFGGGRGVRVAAYNVADALRLKTTLRLQEAGILDENGRLTELAIERSVVIMDDGSVLKNQSIIDALTKDGGCISDWQKLSSESVTMPTGQRIQVHYYRNKTTGVVDYITTDFKVKNPINLFPKGKPQPEPTIRPPYDRY